MILVDRPRLKELSEPDDHQQKHSGECEDAPNAHAPSNIAIHGNRLHIICWV